MPDVSPDDAELDVLWREVFGEPLPMLGAPEIARKILEARRGQDGPLL